MTFVSPTMRARLLSVTLLASLTACATTTAGSGPTDVLTSLTSPKVEAVESSFCAVAKPILWSAKDTDETIRQAKAHNAVFRALCMAPPT